MQGLMFPKPGKKKKRKKHKKSILQQKDDRRCYLCMHLDNDYSTKRNLEEHHAMFGCGHVFAEEEGLKVNLCEKHHRTGHQAVHNNKDNAEYLKRKAQEAFEKDHTREEWTQNGRKNYL